MSENEMVALTPSPELSMSVGEALFTQRAIRRFDPDREVSDADLELIIDAASKAPNGGNVQPVRLLVIRDRDRIAAFGDLYQEAWWAKRADAYGWVPDQELPAGQPLLQQFHHFDQLNHLAHADRIDGFTRPVQTEDGFEDVAVRRLVEMLGLEEFDDIGDGLSAEEHGTEHGLLCLEVPGRQPL